MKPKPKPKPSPGLSDPELHWKPATKSTLGKLVKRPK